MQEQDNNVVSFSGLCEAYGMQQPAMRHKMRHHLPLSCMGWFHPKKKKVWYNKEELELIYSALGDPPKKPKKYASDSKSGQKKHLQRE